MAITYTWSFPTLTAYPTYESQTDVVYTVHWTLTGTDGTYTGSVYGTVGLTYVAGSPYTPYAQLTEANIAAQIQQQISPTSVNLPPPWGA